MSLTDERSEEIGIHVYEMSAEEALSMGFRALRLEGWRWMEGMRTLRGDRVIRCAEDGTPVIARTRNLEGLGPMVELDGIQAGDVPDLRDPATVGCLLHLVRSIVGEPYWRPHGLIGSMGALFWLADTPLRRERQTRYDSEAEAIIVRAEKFLREAEQERAVE